MKKMLRIAGTGSLVFAVAVAMSGLLAVGKASAAALTSKSDVMTRLEAGIASNHTIQFTTPTGVPASGTITVSFPSGFTMNSLDYADLDLKDDTVDVTLAGSPSGATWGAALSSQDIVFTNGSAAVVAGSVIEIQIGTNADAGDTQITNHATPAEYTIAIATSSGDSGDINIPIIADDSVNVTATVDESISFAISDTEIGFGTLSASKGRWATGTTGGDASAAEPTAAHTLSIGTNATGGYIITYNGATLTSGGDDITATTGGISGDGDGTPGTEQFGICASRSDDATIASGYQRDATPDWKFAVSTPTTLVSETGPTATEVISVSYLANISAQTEAGAYSTDITYIATATF